MRSWRALPWHHCRPQHGVGSSRRRAVPGAGTLPVGVSGVHKKRFPGRVFRPGNPKRTAATYSPTWWGSTIGACELNFSVRNGKRWDLTAVTAAVCYRERLRTCIRKHGEEKNGKRKGFGLLVRVGFAIADFTPPAYRRGRLPRPSTKSHLGDGFALRCFQRLS